MELQCLEFFHAHEKGIVYGGIFGVVWWGFFAKKPSRSDYK